MNLTDRPLPAALAFWEGAPRRLTWRRAGEGEDEEGKKAELDGPARWPDGEGRAGAAARRVAAAARRSAMVVGW